MRGKADGCEETSVAKVICDWCEGDGRARAVHPSLREGVAMMMKATGMKPVELDPPMKRFDWKCSCMWCGGTGEREPQ